MSAAFAVNWSAMPLCWKNCNLIEQPYREHLTRRELLLIRLLCAIMALLTTAWIPSAWTYPKQIWADWIPVGAVIFLALLFWAASIGLWRNGSQLLTDSTATEADECAPDQIPSEIRHPKSEI